MKKCLIIGGDSVVGSALKAYVAKCDVGIEVTSRRPGEGALFDLAQDVNSWNLPTADIAFICAGISGISDCSDDPTFTHFINVEQTIKLIDVLYANGSHIVYPSTSLVFDGTQAFPRPSDPVEPTTQYAMQKVEVENYLLNRGKGAVLRFTKVAESIGLLDRWHQKLQAGECVEAFDDAFLAPVPLNGVAQAMFVLGDCRVDGAFHYSASEDISYTRMAHQISKFCRAGTVGSLSSEDTGWSGPPFPNNTALNMEALTDLTGLTSPSPLDVINGELARRFNP